MKKFSKIVLILCLALVCVGIVCIGAGAAMGSSLEEVRQMANNGDIMGFHIRNNGLFLFDLDNLDDTLDDIEVLKGAVEQSFDAEDIKELDIELYYGSILIEDSESDQITVSIDAPKRRTYACKADGKTLILEETTKHAGANSNSLKADITIGIPAGMVFDEVDFNTSAGNVEITHSLLAREIALEVDAGKLKADSITAEKSLGLTAGAGEIILDNFLAETVDLDCGVGNMELKGRVERDLEASCGVGNIDLELEGEAEDYNYEISCGMGSIKINDKNYSALGREKEINNHAEGEISLDCGVGNIKLELKNKNK